MIMNIGGLSRLVADPDDAIFFCIIVNIHTHTMEGGWLRTRLAITISALLLLYAKLVDKLYSYARQIWQANKMHTHFL